MPKKIGEQKTKSEKTKSERKPKAKGGLTLPLYGLKGSKISDLEVSKKIFAEKENKHLIAQYVRVYLANQRAGSASTKTRSEVKGSTRKIYKQKGTGRARHGDIKAPIFVGGGVVGGPKPRSHSLRMNKKQIRKALYSAFSVQYREKNIIGLSDEFLSMEIKTNVMNIFFKTLGFSHSSILFLVPKVERNNLLLSVRNLPFVTIRDIASVNPYEILAHRKICIMKSALMTFEKAS